MLGLLRTLPMTVAASIHFVAAPVNRFAQQMHTLQVPLKLLRCLTPRPEENAQTAFATQNVFSPYNARRWLNMSSRTDDKHAKQKEAFMRMLQESKEALKKLDKQIQGKLPSKDEIKNSLQTLGDQLATKMETLSRGYREEASRLTGSAQKTLLDASKKMKDQADKLRSEHPTVDEGVKKMKQAMEAAKTQATRVNETVKPHVKKNVDMMAAKTKEAAKKSMKEGEKVGQELAEKMKKQAPIVAEQAALKAQELSAKAKQKAKEMVEKSKMKADEMAKKTKQAVNEKIQKGKKKLECEKEKLKNKAKKDK